METEVARSPFEAELRAMAGPNVTFHSEVDHAEVPGILADADIGVVPFLPTRNHVDALPNKIFEYMRAGLPIVASDFDLWRQTISEPGCGLVVNPADPSQISAALDALATDPGLREKMGQRALARVRDDFSWKFAERRLLGSYADLAERHGLSGQSFAPGSVPRER